MHEQGLADDELMSDEEDPAERRVSQRSSG